MRAGSGRGQGLALLCPLHFSSLASAFHCLPFTSRPPSTPLCALPALHLLRPPPPPWRSSPPSPHSYEAFGGVDFWHIPVLLQTAHPTRYLLGMTNLRAALSRVSRSSPFCLPDLILALPVPRLGHRPLVVHDAMVHDVTPIRLTISCSTRFSLSSTPRHPASMLASRTSPPPSRRAFRELGPL